MNPSNANNKTLFTPASAEAKLADMQRVLATYNGPNATLPIPRGKCRASVLPLWDTVLLMDGHVDNWVAEAYVSNFGTYFTFSERLGKMDFFRTVMFEEDYADVRYRVDMLMWMQALYEWSCVHFEN